LITSLLIPFSTFPLSHKKKEAKGRRERRGKEGKKMMRSKGEEKGRGNKTGEKEGRKGGREGGREGGTEEDSKNGEGFNPNGGVTGGGYCCNGEKSLFSVDLATESPKPQGVATHLHTYSQH
jgi:hypothetical protein